MRGWHVQQLQAGCADCCTTSVLQPTGCQQCKQCKPSETEGCKQCKPRTCRARPRPLSPHLQTQKQNNLVTDHHLYHPPLETNCWRKIILCSTDTRRCCPVTMTIRWQSSSLQTLTTEYRLEFFFSVLKNRNYFSGKNLSPNMTKARKSDALS